MYCMKCGKEISGNNKLCPDCASGKNQAAPKGPVYIMQENPKSKTIFVLLDFFLGLFGIHNFYVGDFLLGVAKLAFLGVGFLLSFTVKGNSFVNGVIYVLALLPYIWSLAEIGFVCKTYHEVLPDGTEINDNYYNKIYKKRHIFD